MLPFDAFVQRLYEDALYADARIGPDGALPMLLSAAQEEQLWLQVVEKAGLLVADGAAARCQEAWRLAHQWRIEPGRATEDSQAFSVWASEYRKKTLDGVDAARLPDLVSTILDATKKPKVLVAYAFDILPPQTRELLAAFDALGVRVEPVSPEKKSSRAVRTSFSSPKDELEQAAAWARARLEAGKPRIGVVVPDLAQRRKEVARVFSRVMQPGFNLPGAAKSAQPFNISIGLPLIQYPVVALALSILRFSKEEIPFEEASRLLRSPFIAGGEKECSYRAALDARLRRSLEATVSLPRLIANLDRKSILRERLERLFALRDDGLFADKAPSDWARHFSALLDAVGFPGERTLDSHEYQALAKWHEVLGEFSRLERVAKVLSFSQAIHIVKKQCVDTLFQPESAGAPVQVLGVLESAGLELDCLWVSGLTDEAWPIDAAPNPFLPVAAQKAAGLPEASAESSLALDRRITEGWLGAAGEVVFSFFKADQDRVVSPSPLILGIAEGAVEVPAYPRLRDSIFSGRKIEKQEDLKAPALAAKTVKGGTRVLTDQAACPFRAFAHHRLRAEKLETPHSGLDERQRGTLLHSLMRHLWDALKTSEALARDLEPAIREAAGKAVKDLQLEGRFAEIERERLVRIARAWLEKEKAREPFEVVINEEPRPIEAGGLSFQGRIDRMDRLSGGGYALLDYKTGNATRRSWLGERPDEPQMPLYAISSPEDIAAVSYIRLKPGKLGFMGYARKKDLLPKVEMYKDWEGLIAGWRREIEALGSGFASGQAAVDPKRELQTCRRCDLHTLCRVYEKLNPLKEDEAMEGADE